jgi:hypothetical protein
MDMDKLTDVVALLINEQPLLPKHEPPCVGNIKGNGSVMLNLIGSSYTALIQKTAV